MEGESPTLNPRPTPAKIYKNDAESYENIYEKWNMNENINENIYEWKYIWKMYENDAD